MTQPDWPQDLVGVVLDGRYRLSAVLGTGGMAAVYLAEPLAAGPEAAIKVLRPDLAADASRTDRFLNAHRFAANIRHCNVVAIHDFGSIPQGPPFVVMELVRGRTLSGLVRANGPLPWARARPIVLQLLAALKAAHRLGVIHSDVKPGNCFVLPLPKQGVLDFLKVSNFGISRALETPDTLVGTADYMSPEYIQGHPRDRRSDLYAVGITVYELLTGVVPFRSRDVMDVLRQHVHVRPPALRTIRPDLPASVLSLVSRALAKDPKQRFQTAREFEQAVLTAEPPRTQTPRRFFGPVFHEDSGAFSEFADTDPGGVAQPVSSGFEDTDRISLRQRDIGLDKTAVFAGNPVVSLDGDDGRGENAPATGRANSPNRDEPPLPSPIVDEEAPTTNPRQVQDEDTGRITTRAPVVSADFEPQRDGIALTPAAPNLYPTAPDSTSPTLPAARTQDDRRGRVLLGASAPGRTYPGHVFSTRFVAHHHEQLQHPGGLPRPRATQTDVGSDPPTWKLGAVVRVRLTGTHLTAQPPEQMFVWNGRNNPLDFSVRVDSEADIGLRIWIRFEVSIGEHVIGEIRHVLEVIDNRTWEKRLSEPLYRWSSQPAYTTAYASFHAADWRDVNLRLSRLHDLAGLRIESRCLSTDPREQRKPRLKSRIETEELFILFWSPNAAASAEVDWEWRTAVETRGLEFVRVEPMLPFAPLPGPLQRFTPSPQPAALPVPSPADVGVATLPRNPNGVDVLLVTTTELETSTTRRLVQEAAGLNKASPRRGNTLAYHDLGAIEGATIALVQAQPARTDGMSSTVQTAINELTPAAIIIVGTAYGKGPATQTIGDVLVSQQVRRYHQPRPPRTLGNSNPNNGGLAFASTRLLGRFSATAGLYNEPNVHFGLLLSAHPTLGRNAALELDPEALGGDVQTASVDAVLGSPNTPWVVVKGISEWADDPKPSHQRMRQQLAATHAATVVVTTLKNGGFASPRTHQTSTTAVEFGRPVAQDSPYPAAGDTMTEGEFTGRDTFEESFGSPGFNDESRPDGSEHRSS